MIRFMVQEINIRAITEDDRPFICSYLREAWFDERLVVHGEVIYPSSLSGYIAEVDGFFAGLATFRIDGSACELVSLNSVKAWQGAGTRLLAAVIAVARQAGCRRLWLVTTNDNLDALRFYQRRGLRITAIRPGAVDAARVLKPSIPLSGEYGIPLHDEIEMEIVLNPSPESS